MGLSTNTQSNTGGVANVAIGNVATDAAAAADTTFTCGFQPRYIMFMNRTDGVSLEWYEGMAANSALRNVAAGTRTLDVASGVTVGTPASGTGGQFTIKAADIPASKAFSWMAIG